METTPAGSTPVPDPTELTTQALLREIAGLREFVLSEIGHVREISQTKFASMTLLLEGMAARTAEQKKDTKDALDAALEAAKDAVRLQTEAGDKAIAKSETAFTKQIDALAQLVEKSDKAKDEKINDLKSRMDMLEAGQKGVIQAALHESLEKKSTGIKDVLALVISAAFVLIGLSSLLYTIAQQ
jgi:hypothetical protein